MFRIPAGLAVGLALALTACGGGGGGSAETTATNYYTAFADGNYKQARKQLDPGLVGGIADAVPQNKLTSAFEAVLPVLGDLSKRPSAEP